ncbi:alpha/beta hydrolase [Filimonas effusa]|uniref:Alpha/beta hydrolase n=1 Tax=Filimonas effusa TaxID=2508721 RepID=A0A4Q1D5D7_9BACT|nr:alpha/beta hydrolase [Filimonas effusa]RXK83710.1 alpha/beta hydrolase [Filimonas effusa]
MSIDQTKGITPIDPSTDPAIESRTKAFLNALNSGGGKPIEELSPSDARGVLTGAQRSVAVDLSGISIEEKTIVQSGVEVLLYIVKPSEAAGELPGFIFVHGGGWVLGDFETHQRLVRDLVVHSGAAAVFVEYSRSPEARYPVAINEIYAALEWVAAHGKEVGIDSSRLAVAGNSVGGNMAAVLALMAKDKNGPALKVQILLWPVTDANFDTDSYHQYATGRFLTRNMMQWFWDAYIPDAGARNDVYASPLQASTSRLQGLPPALVQVAENDVLRDEGEAYARKLDEAGVPVTLVRYQGMIHDFGLLNPLHDVPGVRSHVLQAGAELKKYLFS